MHGCKWLIAPVQSSLFAIAVIALLLSFSCVLVVARVPAFQNSTLQIDPPAFSGAGGGCGNPGLVCHANTSGVVPIRSDDLHQNLIQLLESSSSVLLQFACANLLKHASNVVSLLKQVLRILKKM